MSHACTDIFTSYIDVYHLGLQAASTLMSSIGDDISSEAMDISLQKSLKAVLGTVVATERDFEWIVQAILGSLCMQ